MKFRSRLGQGFVGKFLCNCPNRAASFILIKDHLSQSVGNIKWCEENDRLPNRILRMGAAFEGAFEHDCHISSLDRPHGDSRNRRAEIGDMVKN